MSDNIITFESFRDVILKEYRDDKIVVMTIQGGQVCNFEKFLNQPADGILYDLNILEEVVLSDIEDQRWVNRYASCKVIRALKKKIEELESKLKEKL